MDLGLQKKYLNAKGEIVEIVDYNKFLNWPFIDKNENIYNAKGQGLQCEHLILEINVAFLYRFSEELST